MNLLPNQLLTLTALGIVIYLIRVGGFWLAGQVRFNRFMKQWLGYLPGCVMISVVAPVILTKNPVIYIACGIVILLMYKTKNLFLAMLLGSAFVICFHLI